MARVPQDAAPVPDAEHDEWAWWPANVDEWPDEADPRVKAAGHLPPLAARLSNEGPEPAWSFVADLFPL